MISQLGDKGTQLVAPSLGQRPSPRTAALPQLQVSGVRPLSRPHCKTEDRHALLCHLCAEFSEYLTILPPLLCHTRHPRGSKFSPASTLPFPSRGRCGGFSERCPCPACCPRPGRAGRRRGGTTGTRGSRTGEQSLGSVSDLVSSRAAQAGGGRVVPSDLPQTSSQAVQSVIPNHHLLPGS